MIEKNINIMSVLH